MSAADWAGCLRTAARQLQAAGVEGAARDARRLLAHVLGGAERVSACLRDVPEPGDAKRFFEMVRRRVARVPIAQIIGQREFYGRLFEVGPDVLDPRPETETLVAAALEQPFSGLLDLGCGSGCILLTLLAERPGARGVGCDISEPALAVARRNRARLGLEARARLLRSDWFSAVSGSFDLIVSNPPYVSAAEMASLAPELRHEPEIALSPGGDGLAAYRAIAAGARRHLRPGGRLLLEIGPAQASAVGAILAAGGLAVLDCLADLDGRDRVLIAAAARP